MTEFSFSYGFLEVIVFYVQLSLVREKINLKSLVTGAFGLCPLHPLGNALFSGKQVLALVPHNLFLNKAICPIRQRMGSGSRELVEGRVSQRRYAQKLQYKTSKPGLCSINFSKSE